MLFLTLDCFKVHSALSEEEIDERFRLYREYIKRHSPQLPVPVRMLVEGISLHDARFSQIITNHSQKTLCLKGIAFDWGANQFYGIEMMFYGTSRFRKNDFLALLDEQEIGDIDREELEIRGKENYILRLVCQQGGARRQKLAIIEIPFTHLDLSVIASNNELDVHDIKHAHFTEIAT